MAKQLGKYEIIRTLGQGAMGEVYLAHHPAIGREVAIKTILPSAARGEDAEGRFRREATAAGKLNHPNLVTIYDFDKDGDVLYLVMEYVKGDDLDDLIQQRALSQSQFLEVLAQICDGLSFAHRSGIVHRDIKPTNVRVIRDGKRILSKVMDFGIARVEDSGMTATGIVMGTVSYMAPEYIQSGKAAAQCDLWAVGVMLYECLAGCKPFHADNTTTILFKIVTEVAKPLEPGVIQGVSTSIHKVLEKALAKDPTQRFQTADDFARALRACKDPSWIGSIEEATARTGQQPIPLTAAGIGTEQGQEVGGGTELLQASPSMAMGVASAPTIVTSVPPAPPTALVPALPNANDPTQMLTAQVPAPVPAMTPTPVPAQTAPAKGGSRMGLYAAAGFGLLVIGGGAWYLHGRKNHQELPTATNQTISAASAAPQAGAPSTSPASAPLPGAAPVESPKTSHVGVSAVPSTTATPVSQVKPEPTRTEAPKQAEDTPAQKLAKAASMIGSNPTQAASLLRGLAASQPGDLSVQGNLLAALYRSHNAGEFERVLDGAKARGLNCTAMMKAAPAFRLAMEDERGAHRAKNGSNVLPVSVLLKVVQ